MAAKRYATDNVGGVLTRALKQRDYAPMQVTGDGFYAVIGNTQTFVLPPLDAALCTPSDGYSVQTAADGTTVIRSATPRGVLYGFTAWERGVRDCVEIPDSSFRAAHIDLRYGFWNEDRWEMLLDRLVSLRYNTLILETENRLPFASHPDVAAPEHFTKESLERLLEMAAARFLEVIPLQQTLGHLEYLLKLPAYYPLREVREHPTDEPLFYTRLTGANHYHDFDEICPSNAAAREVVSDLLCDALSLFPDSRYMHIGCDEAWNLLYCDDCRTQFGNKTTLLIEHLNRVAAQVIDSGKTPIIWDDMLRRMSEDELRRLDSRIVVMSWLYFAHHPDADAFLRRFQAAGLTVLGAASAKCSIGTLETLDLPDYGTRFGNADWWANACDTYGLSGFAVTVWSNYSGTIAPPHPLFDTAWLPLYYGACRLWKHDTPRAEILSAFNRDFFGVDVPVEGLSAGALLPVTEQVAQQATRNADAAELWHLSVLLSFYRLKSASIGRELYRYHLDITDAERGLLDYRVAEVRRLRDWLYPRLETALRRQYSERETALFMAARFWADDRLYAQ